MDREIERYLMEEIKKEKKKILLSIQDDCKELLEDAIQTEVYDAYDPIEYERTYALNNSVNSHINTDDELYVFTDTNEGLYYSAVDGRDVSVAVPHFVNSGHTDNTGINNQYHNYEGRNFLEKAKELIDKKFGCDCEVIDDVPPKV